MLPSLLLILGAAALSMGLRSFPQILLQKLGALGIFATSFLAGYLMGRNNIYVGLFCASTWLLLPWLEILTRIRNLRLPLEKSLTHQSPPSSEAFPDLNALTAEIEGEDFEYADDSGWDWDDYRQFFRLFYKSSERAQAAICFIDQQDIAFYYLSISSRAKDGAVWTTWNYPFSHSLKPVPQLKINRMRATDTFLQMYERREFLRQNGIEVSHLEELSGEQIQVEIQKDLRAQIAHNLAQGVLTQAGEGQIRYSWRGLFFIWVQFLRDLVRLS